MLENRRDVRAKVMQALFAFKSMEGEPRVAYNLLLAETEKEVEVLEKNKGISGDVKLLKTLFFETIRNAEMYDSYLREKAANWDIERIARLDRVLMQMAICELLNFEEIPVKVTLNEYMELAKEYSTPDSSKFINGVLDALIQLFISKGLIRKNERGSQEDKVPPVIS
ncbi:MAG: transcription antitermination factor NusB [Bacteroidia bacterium]|nr:transcription antitermination factor NusB [Bacteroidia bacterium]